MADDKDDNGLKKAEEALEKAEQKLALTVEGTPAHKKAAEALVKAKENRLAANFRKGQRMGDLQEPPLVTPAVLEPRGRGGLDTPPAPAPNLGGAGQLSPLRSNSDTIADRAKSNELDPPPATTAPVGKSKKTDEEKAARKRKKEIKEAAQFAKDAAKRQRDYDANLAWSAEQAKKESEGIASIRARHEKNMPSSKDEMLSKISGGVLGAIMGTFQKRKDAQRGSDEEVALFKAKNKIQDDIRKGAAMARSTRAGATASSVLSLSEKNAISNSGNVLTSNAFGNKLFEDGKNPLVGIGTNTNKDTPAQVRDWYAKTSKKAFAGNMKAQREIATAASRIADRKERLLPFVQKDDLIEYNKDIYYEKMYASVPKYLGEASEVMASIDYMWHDAKAVKDQLAAWETLNAYYQMYDMLAASAGTEGKYAKFAGDWAKITDNPASPILRSVQAMTAFAEDNKITITAQQRNLRDVKDAGRRVTDIKAEIKRLENDDNHDEAIWMRENELSEAQDILDLTLLFSGHSDLKVRQGEDGGVEVYSTDSEIDFPLIVSEYSEKFGLSYHVNEEKISQIPDPIKRAEVRALAGIAKKEAGKHLFDDPPVTERPSAERYASAAEIEKWRDSQPEKAARMMVVLDGIVDKINSDDVTYDEVIKNSSRMEKELTKEERDMMRNFYAMGVMVQLRLAARRREAEDK